MSVGSFTFCYPYSIKPLIYLHLIFSIFQFEISSLMNWIFLPPLAGKIQVWNRLKIKFIKLLDTISNCINAKLSADWLGEISYKISQLWRGSRIWHFQPLWLYWWQPSAAINYPKVINSIQSTLPIKPIYEFVVVYSKWLGPMYFMSFDKSRQTCILAW